MKANLYHQLKRESERLVVRPYLFNDFALCKSSREARLEQQNQFDSPVNISNSWDKTQFKNKVIAHREKAKSKTQFIFGVFDKKEEFFLGQVDLFTISSVLKWGNLGYNIHNQFWGKGYAKEASEICLKIAFEDLGFHRVEAAMDLENLASEKVAQKLGLDFEGVRKKFLPDELQDMKVYATNHKDFSSYF